jgi:hypothetical protein
MTKTIEQTLSACCDAPLIGDTQCEACGGDGREVCEYCGGVDGEHEDVTTMEQVYPGEPHMADIGTAPCPATVE